MGRRVAHFLFVASFKIVMEILLPNDKKNVWDIQPLFFDTHLTNLLVQTYKVNTYYFSFLLVSVLGSISAGWNL